MADREIEKGIRIADVAKPLPDPERFLAERFHIQIGEAIALALAAEAEAEKAYHAEPDRIGTSPPKFAVVGRECYVIFDYWVKTKPNDPTDPSGFGQTLVYLVTFGPTLNDIHCRRTTRVPSCFDFLNHTDGSPTSSVAF